MSFVVRFFVRCFGIGVLVSGGLWVVVSGGGFLFRVLFRVGRVLITALRVVFVFDFLEFVVVTRGD